uniref:TYRO protein tyrosine kinase-binding protein n=1 Tax=Cyprinodon variegatus TaxID=28743 RepID=A0A3Q2FN14_CYPVA
MPDALCVVGSMFDCGPCYLINVGSVIGIIASDIILSIFLIICVFCFTSLHRRRRERETHDGRRNLPLSASKKITPELTESPYEELHGVQSDIYNELRHISK